MTTEYRDGPPVARQRSRLGRWFAVALAAALVSATVSACGGSSDNKSSTSKQAGAVSSASGAELVKMLGYTQKDIDALKGKTIKLGASLALSGPEAAHGALMRNGIELARKDIAAAGGPNIEVQYEDHKGSDPQASVDAIRSLGESGHAVTLASYEFAFGSQLPMYKRYKMLAIDPGGGTGGLFNGNDFAWGFRGIEPDDSLKGGWRYVHENYPQVKRVGSIIWDAGDAFVKALAAKTKAAVEANGLTWAGYVRSKIGATDYSDAISKMRAMNVDAVHLNIAGVDLAYATKQWHEAGLGAKPLLGNEYLPEMSPIAGNSFKNWLFAVDYWTPQDYPNPLTKLFVKHFTESYGKPPTSFYEANFYEATLAIWELARRIAESGGDLNSGPDWQKALESKPEFISLYGKDPNKPGIIKLDLKTHSPSIRPAGVWQLRPDKPVQVAEFNVGGGDYKQLKPAAK